jgi:hypothetical protein
VEQEIEALLGAAVAEEVDLEAVETALRRRVLRVAARQLQERFNADHSDYAGTARPCACGQQARYVERRAKRFASVLGELSLERAYYHCSACGQGHCPRDQALGLEGASCSPGVQRMVASVGAAVSFEEGSTLLRELAGVEVNAKQVEGRKGWGPRLPKGSGGPPNPSPRGPPLRPCIWAWTGQEFRCARPSFGVVRGSSPTVRPRRER